MESLIAALGPAFAAGFAVQRLLEIIDPILTGRVKDENKKRWLGVISLLIGLVLAYVGRLRVLAPLGANLDTRLGLLGGGVDYFVTALIISAGTEGFNSIMKFLSYKKEEKKAEAVQEKTTALRQLASSRMLSSEGGSDATDRVLAASFAEFKSVEDRLEGELKSEIIKRWESKFIEDGWKGRAFGEYSNHLDAHRETVHDATVRVAGQVGISIPDSVLVRLQKKVGLDTTPKAILPEMRNAIG